MLNIIAEYTTARTYEVDYDGIIYLIDMTYNEAGHINSIDIIDTNTASEPDEVTYNLLIAEIAQDFRLTVA